MEMKDALTNALGKEIAEKVMQNLAKKDETVRWFNSVSNEKRMEVVDKATAVMNRRLDLLIERNGGMWFDEGLKRAGFKSVEPMAQALLMKEAMLALALCEVLDEEMSQSQGMTFTAEQIDAMADRAKDVL